MGAMPLALQEFLDDVEMICEGSGTIVWGIVGLHKQLTICFKHCSLDEWGLSISLFVDQVFYF